MTPFPGKSSPASSSCSLNSSRISRPPPADVDSRSDCKNNWPQQQQARAPLSTASSGSLSCGRQNDAGSSGNTSINNNLALSDIMVYQDMSDECRLGGSSSSSSSRSCSSSRDADWGRYEEIKGKGGASGPPSSCRCHSSHNHHSLSYWFEYVRYSLMHPKVPREHCWVQRVQLTVALCPAALFMVIVDH